LFLKNVKLLIDGHNIKRWRTEIKQQKVDLINLIHQKVNLIKITCLFIFFPWIYTNI